MAVDRPFKTKNRHIHHEFIEAITDPEVGFAQSDGPPLGWYDPNNGEIGDICNAQHGTITVNGVTYTVQREWSNSAMHV